MTEERYKTVEQSIIEACKEGKFEHDGEYLKYSADEWKELSDEEKAAVKSEIKVGIFEDCIVKVADIFSWGYEE